MEGMNAKEMLGEVNTAISSVLNGGQSYKIGSRMLTRADLGLLYKMQKDLMAQMSRDDNSFLLDDTFVAVFGGR